MFTKIKYSVDIDKKWQKKWAEQNLYRFNEKDLSKKLYCLEMFSYPSGANLHLGHWYNYAAPDTWARFKRMNGYNVFHPQGFDAFGLPAENYAIKTGVPPEKSTRKNIQTMTEQLKRIGATFNWEYTLNTCDEEYYKWTQWIFVQMYKKGLAYRKDAPVNWCPKCNTVLANEQVVNGKCDRCGTDVYQKKMNQWFFKITDYAEELLQGIDKLDWPEKTKKIQKNWIGKSNGALISFDIEKEDGTTITLEAFTSRADTLCGLSYVVLSPEHEKVLDIVYNSHKEEVIKYIENAGKITELERMLNERKRTGVFTGAYAINPINGKKVPVWVADYVIASYGTGFVMAVPAHDERDFDFAQNHNLPILQVITDTKSDKFVTLPFCNHGKLVNSGKYNGLTTEAAITTIVKDLEKVGKGKLTSMYRLRDWLISRQRYWGTPIPIVYCEKCGEVPVPESQLPVKLPKNVEFTPTGDSPLKSCDEFMNTTCPICGGAARREADTMDTFVDSSWYFLRYPDNKNSHEIFNKEKINAMLPVDKYIGGQEHATMHLLYARFFTKVLRDLGYLNFDEPFLSLIHQGLILGPDGAKMSKSKGNTICPDDYINKYGSDVFRMYIEFAFSYVTGGPWSDTGIEGVAKFFTRIEKMFAEFYSLVSIKYDIIPQFDKDLVYAKNFAVDNISKDIEKFQFNTAIARLMEYTNAIYDYMKKEKINYALLKDCLDCYIILLSPFAPHFAEELWEQTDHTISVFNEKWPSVDEKALVKDKMNITIQINGKVRSNFLTDVNLSEAELINEAVSSAQKYLINKKIIRTIYVPQKLINIVVSDN